MGLFGGGGASAPDLRPFLRMTQKAVTNAEGKMSNYDSVIDNFTQMGLDKYNASQDFYGPWQERMNQFYLNTTASNYGQQLNQNYASQLRQFNKRASDKFFAAGIPMGPAVAQQRGLNQEILQAQYSAQTDFTAKHQVAQMHEQAMRNGDLAMQQAFNQMTAGVNMQQAVSDMYAQNAVNQSSNAMAKAGIYAGNSWAGEQRSIQKQNDRWGAIGSLAGMGAMAGMNGMFSSGGGAANAGQGPTVALAQSQQGMDNLYGGDVFQNINAGYQQQAGNNFGAGNNYLFM